MDVAGANPYTRHGTMNWLLVLSALFSTLTGVNVGVRPIEAAVQRSALSAQIRYIAAVAPMAVRGHVHLIGGFGTVFGFALSRYVSVATLASPRLYLGRLRV